MLIIKKNCLKFCITLLVAFSMTTNAEIQKTDSLALEPVYPNLSFKAALFMQQQPLNDRRWYLIEQRGRLYSFNAQDNTTQVKHTLLDLSQLDIGFTDSCGECGLLGLTFDPDFDNNGFIYLSYTVVESNPNTPHNMQSVVSRFTSQNKGGSITASSKVDLIQVAQPYGNHNGGHIAFGSDGFLYIGLGDGGSGNDPLNHGQNKTSLLGTILRLNKDGSPAPGNIAAKSGAAKEIYAYGLRNPWRWSFDRKTQQLWAADVGQNKIEEINIITNGGNYGWRCKEASSKTSNKCTSSEVFIDPVGEYQHDEGQSITGGYVYRGNELTNLVGTYVFGDFVSGKIWGLSAKDTSADNTTKQDYERVLLIDSNLRIASFAQANNGDIFVLNYSGGLYKLTTKVND